MLVLSNLHGGSLHYNFVEVRIFFPPHRPSSALFPLGKSMVVGHIDQSYQYIHSPSLSQISYLNHEIFTVVKDYV